MPRSKSPDLQIEKEMWDAGRVVVGIDEVGKGAWAGPLTVAAAVVPKDRRIYKVRDSKQIAESKREEMFDKVAAWVADYGVGHASHAECDRFGMSEAQRLATTRAIEQLSEQPTGYILDGKWNFCDHLTAESDDVRLIVKGDQKSLSIAAASILAKVTRDRIMREQSPEFPEFEFVSNKGYPSPIHREMLEELGPTSIHRQSWAPVRNYRNRQTSLPV